MQTILSEPMPDIDLKHLAAKRATQNVTQQSRRRWMTQVCGVSLAGAAAVLLVVSLFAIRPVDAWAQVVKAVQKQPWVRMQASAPDKSAQVEIWFSPAKRIGAGRFPGSSFFLELDQFKLQRFDLKESTIYVSDPQSSDLDQFVALDAALDAFANRKELQQSKTETVKLLGQSSKKGSAGDERWTDHVLDYEDARRSPPRFRRVFRVPDGAELPTSMTEEWNWEGKQMARTHSMDYPATGPSDIFALDVPKDAKVVDTRSGEELKTLLAAYSKQQNSAFDNYTATVLKTIDDWRSINEAFRIRLAAAGHSAEVVDFEQLQKFQMNRFQQAGRIVPETADADRLAWWQVEVDKMTFNNFGQRDMFSPGQTFCPDLVGYPGLGYPNQGVKATLNPKPFVGPNNCQMLTIENTTTGDYRFWFDSERGSMVVRWEHQSVDRKPGDWIDTTIIDAAEKSPKGRWFATQVRRGQVERSGDDLRPVAGVAPVSTTVYRYLIKFDEVPK